jgi:hypothetical protein
VSENSISGTKHKIIIVDHAFNEHDSIVKYANNTAYYQPPGSCGTYYPGHRDEMPEPYYNAFSLLLQRVFPKHLKHQVARCWLSKITLAPEQLSPFQTMPHYDSLFDQDMAAIHYLSGEELGGTNFYRYKDTEKIALSIQDEAMIRNMLKKHTESEFKGYIGDSNSVFEKIHSVTAKPNRVVIYSGNILHSPSITPNVSFDKKSSRCRTSINSFFKQFTFAG